MDTPTQNIPKVEAIFTLDDIIKQVEASGVNLGDDPKARVNTFINEGLLPPTQNGRFPSWAVQRIIAIQDKLLEGKSLADLKEETAKERRRFLNQATDLHSMADLYKKFSNNSMFMMASFLFLALVVIGTAAATIAPNNPVVVAGKNTVKAAVDAGGNVAKRAASPVGRTLVTIIKTSKPEDSTSADPLQLTNLEVETPVIPENLVQFDEFGNLIVKGKVSAITFSGSGVNLTDLPWSSLAGRPRVLSAINGVGDDEGNIDLVAGTGISISSDSETNSITLSALDMSSSQFIFKNIVVSGQSTIASDINSDTLTFIAGSNVSLATNAANDSLTIGVTGTVSNADTLDLLDSGQFLRSDIGDTMGGNINLANNLLLNIGAAGTDFTATGGLNLADDLVVNANFSVLGADAADDDCIYFDTGTNESLCWMNAPPGEFAFSHALSVTGNFYASSHLYTGGTLRVGNDGTLYNINAITASGATTITDDVTIGGADSNNDWLTMTRSSNANVIQQTRSSNRIVLEGAYWDGGASQNVEMHLMTLVSDTTPTYWLSIMRGPGSEVARFEYDGDAVIYGDLSLTSGGNLSVAGGQIDTAASQLILQANGANADVVVQGGLCVRDATACNDVAAGGLEVDTAGGSGDDPGDVFDVAEIYNSIQPVSPGEVVSAAGSQSVKKSSTPYDQGIIGIASSHPAALIDQGTFKVGVDQNKFNSNKPWVALAGRVPVKVTAENGDIAPGDPLTSSSTPGVAMKATKSGPIIGKALEGYGGSGVGKIMIFVSTGWYVAGLDVGSRMSDIGDLSDINVGELTAGTINTQVLFIGDRQLSVSTEGTLVIDGDVSVDGVLSAKQVKTDELIVSGETSGTDIIKAGQKKVTIESTKVVKQSKILVTFSDDYSPATRYWVTKKSGESFTVHLNQPTTSKVSFDWLIIN
jgi:hypothetical protein